MPTPQRAADHADRKLFKDRPHSARLVEAQFTFLSDSDTAAPVHIPTPRLWHESEVFDAPRLEELGFRAKSEVESFWTPADLATFRAGAADLAARRQHMPSEITNPAYYMSHHVMQRRFSIKACQRQILRMAARLQFNRAIPEPAADVAAERHAERLAQRAEVGSDADSEDEVALR